MRGRGRLVRAFASKAVGQGRAGECLAGLWEAVDCDRDVLVNRTDDDDAFHEGSFASGCSIVPRRAADDVRFDTLWAERAVGCGRCR